MQTNKEVMRETVKLERPCYDCGKMMVGKRENYSYQEVGLKSVVLLNIVVYHCKCGAIVPEIPYTGILHSCIAMSVLEKKALLSGEEIRFIRKAAGFSATGLARVLGMEKGTVSRWENSKQGIGKDADRLLRAVCFARTMERLAGVNTQQIPDKDLASSLARLQAMIRSVNLTTILGEIEDKAEGSKPIRIDPEYAAMASHPNFVETEAALQ
ncbi:MAG: helix-turn-helix domain-containing protein [Terriglobales bacterium]